MRKLRFCLLLVLILGFSASLGWAATNIDTTPAWDGFVSICPFGTPDTATYGQLVTVPATDPVLQSFTFYMNQPAALTFSGYVYAWDGTKATGPQLYKSPPMTTSGSGFEAITFDTGGLALVPGAKYVLFASTSEYFGGPSLTGCWGFTGVDAYASGEVVFYNNGSNFSLLTSSTWDMAGQWPLDMAFKADFTGCLPPPSGMVAWWAGDGNANDIVGGHNGTAQGGVAYAAGKVGQAFSLNGSAYVQVPDADTLDITGAITIDAWIYPVDLGGRIADKITAGGTNGYLLDTFGGVVRLIIGSIGLSGSTALPVNTWTHVAGTYDGANLRVYVNGVLDGTRASAVAIPVNSLPLRLGAAQDGGSLFNGLIDEVELFNRALSGPEIAAIYAAGSSGKCKPDIAVDPLTHDFGSVDLGNTSTPQLFTVTNNGESNLVLGQLTLSGANPGDFQIQNDGVSNKILSAVQLPPGAVEWPAASGGNGHYYLPVYAPGGINWTGANAAATAMGGYLATITSAAENTFVYNLAPSGSPYWNGGFGPWLGGFQTPILIPDSWGVADNWQWVTGEPFGYTNWNSGEPNDGAFYFEGNVENYLSFWALFFWNDRSNDNLSTGYIVEFYPHSATVEAVFAPQACGLREANLLIPSNDPDTPVVTVSLQGTGTAVYTITASAGANGAINPQGQVLVNCGANQTFNITPNTGYHVQDVVLDGVTHLGMVTSYTFTNVTANHTIDVTFAPNIGSIFGRIVRSGLRLKKMAGVIVTLNIPGIVDAPVVASAITDILGNYTFAALAPGNYTVIPCLTGYGFTPAMPVVAVGDAAVMQNFVATPAAYTVSGKVTDATGKGLAGATVTVSGGPCPQTATTNAYGNYSVKLPNGTYTLTPDNRGMTFCPGSSQVTVNSANPPKQNFQECGQ